MDKLNMNTPANLTELKQIKLRRLYTFNSCNEMKGWSEFTQSADSTFYVYYTGFCKGYLDVNDFGSGLIPKVLL